jgi:putative oxidoreductase
MEALNKYIHPIARVFLGILFLVAGFGKVMGGAAIGGYIDSKLPGLGFLAWPVSIFEVVAGVFLIIGYQTRPTALLLAAFSLFTAIVFHGFAEQVTMLKNIGLTGGYLLLFVHGAGGMSVDKT